MNRGFEAVRDEMRKCRHDGIMPCRATSRSAGYDFYSPDEHTILPGQVTVVWTDIKAKMPDDEVLMVYVRSSVGKRLVVLANGTGVIDADYYGNENNDGNVGIMLVNYGTEPYIIHEGDRIAQGVFMKYGVVDNDMPKKAERSGGLGSTGR